MRRSRDPKFSHPENDASWFSLLFFNWLTPIVLKGYRNPLQIDDLYPLNPKRTSDDMFHRFWTAWMAEREQHPLPSADDSEPGPKKGTASGPSMTRALWVAFGREFVGVFCVRAVSEGCNIASPILLLNIINFVTAAYYGTPNRPDWSGFMLVAGLFIIQVIGSIAQNKYAELAFNLGIKIRTSLVASVYQKALRLSQKSRQRYTHGMIVNLMSVDTVRLDRTTALTQNAMAAPFVALATTAILIYLLGPSALVGFAVVALNIPIQLTFTRFLVSKRRHGAKVTDQRIKVVQEGIEGIRVVKFQGWEQAVLERLRKLRISELSWTKIILLTRAMQTGVSTLLPALAAICTFIVHEAINGSLNPAVALASLALFDCMASPLRWLPQAMGAIADASVSINRLQGLFLSEEIVPQSYLPYEPNPEKPLDWVLRIENGLFQWAETIDVHKATTSAPEKKIRNRFRHRAEAHEIALESKVTSPPVVAELSNINIRIPEGALVCIIGPVGAGKSSLVQAMVGEMEKFGGRLDIRGSVSYTPQSAWIRNASVKNNILFGLPYDEAKYKRTLNICSLEKDMEILPDGDATEIGERGITLSGGQKQRISLARAVYFDADIVILDDPLSAVDAHVGAHILKHCILGEMKRKTRILVTHQIHVVDKADWVICVNNMGIVEQGTYADLMQSSNGYLAQMVEQYGRQEAEKEQKGQQEEAMVVETAEAATAEATNAEATNADLTIQPEEKSPTESEKAAPKNDAPAKLMTAEERTTGSLPITILFSYIRALGGFFRAGSVFLYLLLSQSSNAGQNYWLTMWSSKQYPFSTQVYMGVYGGLGLFQMVMVIFSGYAVVTTCLRGARFLHDRAIRKVFRSPVTFFDTNPVGRIMNRLSRDVNDVDNEIPENLRMFMDNSAALLVVLVMIVVVYPIFLVPLVPIVFVFYMIQKYYRTTARELKRLDSISRSPLYAHFGETLSGLATIRAFRVQEQCIQENKHYIDYNNRVYYILSPIRRWLGVRLQILSAIVVLAATLISTLSRYGTILPSISGLVMTYSLRVSSSLQILMFLMTEVEMQMNSVERLAYYGEELAEEAAEVIEGNRPSSDWPAAGEIDIKNLTLKYRPELPPVLNNVSLKINAGDKIGIVGRTGAGKSTILVALFRLIEMAEGQIIIDGVDISKIGLHDLRRHLSIIPQDPVLFSGTVRSNLDPFDEYSDQEIWDVLNRCGDIGNTISTNPGKLEMLVSEHGDNFSVGQRQLLCLGRAMLRHSSIVVMDEATASVDLETDRLIQETIRNDEKFKHRTVVTIAHRLNSIIDYTKIVVMGHGKILELGAPWELLEHESSEFHKLVMETGEANAELLKDMAISAKEVQASQQSGAQ
ncbi:P-loop containing nucleoside triphosphate hydrolase protein [Polychytrium aggregatum]|uniref:P-loop containing nucleoside triphosphate hydrolase protein n=1 Tax=Polychytrium aggregatum TaxID=110093 RepID=UPI0022FE902E|nr:P-loop containing nucleoside triphosphate hydrolase protein [Polychytrium aggregatum]KAI9203174.1 P-loop containing nucleoside triphosphate hydrolase protein [Polychytrium aggregatum]